ncbi:hypothetical protein [Xenorhabdus doucetiae]|uniref:FAD dependent oxidoreductase domain-containing protein n=1 Tax=Xenorhabdus doucetiae TaxID=351671 RepID=A0ABY3NRX4_9GAMM|nr:hypothetical protein [Xenorhabdus doucetiae]TYP07524.1 hypothetical protein LY16_01657 [Xenorhabdus doucetiae]
MKYDFIVIGSGAIGSSISYELANREFLFVESAIQIEVILPLKQQEL